MTNQFSGHHAPGFRFRFHVRAISHRAIFLPLEMKSLPQIQRLLNGESPLSVFNCTSIQEAREAFYVFRYNFDFPFWAALEYYIRDINNSSKFIPLILNKYQFHIIDTFQKRYHNRELGRYIVTKSFGKVGVTTCVQAYIHWLQIFKSRKNSCSCSFINGDMYSFQKNLCRVLKREAVYSERDVHIPQTDRHAYFRACRCENKFSGIDFGYVHFADMSKWYDKYDQYTEATIAEIIPKVNKSFDTLVVQEGNIPKEDQIDMQKVQNPYIDRFYRLCYIEHLTNNPPFLLNVITNSTHSSESPYLHINLNDLQGSKHRPDAFLRICP